MYGAAAVSLSLLGLAGQEERRALLWAQALGVLTFPTTMLASGGQSLSLEALAEELTVLAHGAFCLSSMGGILASASCVLASAFHVPRLLPTYSP